MQNTPVALLLGPAVALPDDSGDSLYTAFWGFNKPAQVAAVTAGRPGTVPVLLDMDREQLLEDRRRLGEASGMGFLKDPFQPGWEKDLPFPSRLFIAGYALSGYSDDDKLTALQEVYRFLPSGGAFVWLDLFLPPVLGYLDAYRKFFIRLVPETAGEHGALRAREAAAAPSPCLLQRAYELIQDAGFSCFELAAKLGHHSAVVAFK